MSSDQLNLFSPKDLPVDYKERPPEIDEIPVGTYIIMCDAGYKNKIAASSNIIRTWNKEFKPKESDSRCIGPVHAELVAIYIALKRLSLFEKKIKNCIVYSDSASSCKFLTNKWRPDKKYIKEILDKIFKIVQILSVNRCTIHIFNVKTKSIKRVDRRALQKRKEIENNKNELINKRIEQINKTVIKSKDIKIIKRGNNHFAMPIIGGFLPGFKVSLYPPFCECPWWRIRWAQKDISIIHKRALPCKHLCSLAKFLKEDIKSVFQGQINRVD